MKYRARPIEIEALQWVPTKKGLDEMELFMGRFCNVADSCLEVNDDEAEPNDWVIKDSNGVFKVCRAHLFGIKYEKVEV